MKKRSNQECSYPQQFEEFKKVLHDLYVLHVQKNAEYSPNNIKILGQLGVSLRLIEKVIRVLNLQGFDALEGKLKEKPKIIRFGSLEEEFKDIATLSIIAMLLGRNKWGK